MSQYYQLTSWDEIYRLYPNLQIDNSESVQYMVQDDKIIQYTDAQGQQTVTAIDNSNMQFSQTPSAQQGVFLIEAVETQSLEANRPATSSDQHQVSVEQLNPTVQPPQNIVETQQALVLNQSGTELVLQKEVPSSENKSQCILQMDQNKPQIINQQSQYVIHPIQANVVQVDTSKQQSNSLQTQYISQQQQDVINALKGSTMERTNKKDIQQLPIRQLEGNKGAIVGQINSVTNQQQILMQPVDAGSYRKAVVELGAQDRQLIMQQVDGSKQNSFIVQQLGSNNQFPNQILVNQLKTNKNQHALIQNIQFAQKDPQTLKIQNVENPQFIMQKLDGSKQQPAHYQMQHFIVPQGERHQPKVVVQRLEINKQMTAAPQLIVQQFQPVTSNQGTQFVVQQLDLNKQQNILPYIFSSPTKQETIQEGESGKNDGNSSQSADQRFKCVEKEETLVVQFANNQGTQKTMSNDGNNKQDRRQGTVCVGQEIKSPNQLQEQLVNRINQPIETGGTQTNYHVEQQQNESQRRFIHQEIVQQNHVQRSIHEVQQAELGGKARTIENCPSANTCLEQHKGGEAISGQSQQTSQYIQNDNSDSDSTKTKQEASIQLDKSVVSMQSPVSAANLSQCRRITLKPNESDSYPAGVFIIPRGDNQMYIGQYQPGFRLQGTQTLSHTVVKQTGVDSKTKSNDKGSQTGDLSSQNVVVQQEPPMLLSVACSDPQKNSGLTGLNQHKTPARSPVKPGSVDPTAIKTGEIMITSRIQQSHVNRIPTSMVVTAEQTSESLGKEGARREIIVQPYGQSNISQPTTTVPSSPSQANIRPVKGVGRGVRASLGTPPQRAMVPGSPGVRGVQVQTTMARLPQSEVAVRKPKAVGNVAVGGWAPNTQNQVGPRPIIYQVASVNTSNCGGNINTNNINVVNSTANMNINSCNNVGSSDGTQCVENADETRMLVLLPNGERKLFRLPNTHQNVQVNQLWQQVRFSLGSQISIVSNEQVAEKTSTGQLILKSVAIENQEQTTHDPSNNNNQINTSGIQTAGNVTGVTAVVTQQQRPRGVSPRLANSPAGNTAFRSRTQCSVPRMPAPRIINQRMVTPPQHQQSQTLVTHNVSLPGAVTQIQTVKDGMTPQNQKEPPKFIPGQVAICPFCGISSLDFNKCIRCRRKLPPNVKSQPIITSKKKKPEKCSHQSQTSSDSRKLDSDESSTEAGSSEKEKTCSPVNDKKKTKPSPKKKKIADEPTEILILSSDEEDNSQTKFEASRELPLLSKEPVFETMQLTAEEVAAITKGCNLVDDLMENVQPGLYTTFVCRAIRIGSYKTQSKERVLVSCKGVRLVVPSLKSETVSIIIRMSDIRKILVHFGKQMPVMFIYATEKLGYQIRSQLGMESKTGPYYDPTIQQDETHRRITLILEKATEDNKIAMQSMFAQTKILEEVSEKDANDILVRASPVDEQGVIVARPTDAVKKIMIYPPPPEKGGIPLNNQDYACLGEDQFLNDVIIDFYLKYLLLKVLSPEDRERTHVFSTFFYKRLTTKPKTLRKNDPENDPKLSPAEKRHMRVKGWTKQVNLFEKDFIIVPINEHSHWFLAIICFPGLNGPVRFSDNSPVEPEEVAPKKNTCTVQIGNTTITHIVKTERNTLNVEMDPGSDRDEAEGDQDDLHPSSDDEENEQAEEETQSNSSQVEIPLLTSTPPTSTTAQSKEPKVKCLKKKTFKEPIKQPCILIFDSLAGASRVRVVATLRDYLKIEYKKKMGHDREFSKDTIKGAVPKVPQQNNFTDCGLYVLQYVESFFQTPLHDFKLPLRYLQDWFPEEVVSCKRQDLACLIRSLMEEQGINVDEVGLPNLTFTSDGNTGEDQAKLDEEEDEEEEGEKGTAIASEADNDEEEDMDIDDEEEDPEDGEEEEEEEDEEVYDELVLNEVQKSGIHLNSSCNEMDAEGCPFTHKKVYRHNMYNPSVSDEEQFSEDGTKTDSSERTVISPFREHGKVQDQGGGGGGGTLMRKSQGMARQKKSVPLTEFQDFETQITCNTIEKNIETPTSESDMVMDSEGEEEETRIQITNVENVIITETVCNEEGRVNKLAKERNSGEMTNFVSKFSIENSVRRKEDSAKIKTNCDKKEDGEGTVNISCVKRTSEALKSVRIPKKAERAVFSNKRQKIDET